MLPKNRVPTHPGQMLLKEFLEPNAITQKAFAEHLGWTYARINEIVNGKRGLTAESALAIGEAFEMEPEFWLNLQRDWDLWHARQIHKKKKPYPCSKDKKNHPAFSRNKAKVSKKKA